MTLADDRPTAFDRRTLLKGGAAFAASLAVGGPFQALAARTAGAAPRSPGVSPDYGPLVPVRDQTTGLELLMLPRGFEYLSMGWTRDPLTDGTPTPGVHDGMAAFRMPNGKIHLIRNHEQGQDEGAFVTPNYDPAATGGTTTLVFDPDAGAYVESWASLGGTIRNCAGGPTPWGSWLSCEETLNEPTAGSSDQAKLTKKHGYVFEVPTVGTSDGTALKAMGRFSHEAVAVDPLTGIVYETEDRTPSGFYRFIPNQRGNLAAGGVLQMLAIGSTTRQTYDDPTGTDYGVVSWVTIDNPDPDVRAGDTNTVGQGIAKGGAQFARLEGTWYHDGVVYFVSTSGGPADQGQIFAYDLAAGSLRVLFASPSSDVLNAPDNICVSPRGGIVLCEDGSGTEYMHGLTIDGEIFRFAQNNVVLNGERNGFAGSFLGSEWAGATFEPKNGNWLFANLQSPGITFAITGPWRQGAL